MNVDTEREFNKETVKFVKEKNRLLLSEIRQYTSTYEPIYEFDPKYKWKILHSIPFRVLSPYSLESLYLPNPQPQITSLRYGSTQDILEGGTAFVKYRRAFIKLYLTNDTVRELMDRGKPDYMKGWILEDILYAFWRYDFGLPREGSVDTYESEHVIFGLAIQYFLAKAYIAQGYGEGIIDPNILKNYLREQFGPEGTIVITQHGAKNIKQLYLLINEILGPGWNVHLLGTDTSEIKDVVYRAFYTWEAETNPLVKALIQSGRKIIPSITPQLEEKAFLAFIWDRRFEKFFREELGGDYHLLKRIIPPTCILGEEKYFAMGMPDGVKDILDLSNLKAADRTYVIKISGGSNLSAWSQGVWFLPLMSKEDCLAVLKMALEDKEHLYVLQVYKPGRRRKLDYIGSDFLPVAVELTSRITGYCDKYGNTFSLGGTYTEGYRVHGMLDGIFAPNPIKL